MTLPEILFLLGVAVGAFLGWQFCVMRKGIQDTAQEALIFSQRTLILSLARRAGVDLTHLPWYKEHVQRLDERTKEKKP